MTETAQENAQPMFNIEKLYVKDLSLEIPHAPQIFLERESPQIEVQLNTRVMRFTPIGAVVYRQTLLLARAGRQEQAKTTLEQAIWSYPEEFAGASRQMAELAEKDPAHFSALLEFALQKEQEYRRAVRQQ